MINWKERGKASGIHLAISVCVAAAAATLVFALWYPYPYRSISGGTELFFLLSGVDVAIGPLVTLAVFNRQKPQAELRRDLTIVGLIQLAALGYGLWTMAQARPVHLAFEIDRFRVVHRVDVPDELLARKPADVEAFPWFGPTLVAVRPFRSTNESADATMAALGGLQLGARPDLWEPYAAAKPRVLKAAKPVTELEARFRQRAAEIDSTLAALGRKPESTLYLPLVGRKAFWTAFVDPATADVVGFMPLDPF
jgi:hypothetical protein